MKKWSLGVRCNVAPWSAMHMLSSCKRLIESWSQKINKKSSLVVTITWSSWRSLSWLFFDNNDTLHSYIETWTCSRYSLCHHSVSFSSLFTILSDKYLNLRWNFSLVLNNWIIFKNSCKYNNRKILTKAHHQTWYPFLISNQGALENHSSGPK